MKKVILAEDDQFTAKLIARTLEMVNFEVHHVEDGQSCLDLLEKMTPNLLILDIYMPKLSGMEVLKRFKILKGDIDFPILITTGSTNDDIHEELINLGAHYLLKKPFTGSSLIRDLRQVTFQFDMERLKSTLNRIAVLSEEVEFEFEKFPFEEEGTQVFPTLIVDFPIYIKNKSKLSPQELALQSEEFLKSNIEAYTKSLSWIKLWPVR